jgi:putative hydrolase of the HAD superfamily
MSIKAVFFDAGGVLHTTSQDDEAERNFISETFAALAQCGVTLDVSGEEFMAKLKVRAKEYKKWSEETTTELPAADIWNRYFLKDFDVDPAKVAGCAEHLCELYDGKKARVTMRPHLPETIKKLHDMGIRQGVISNIISKKFVPECIKNYGIEPYMECVILSSVVGRRKPAPEIFAAATGATGLLPSECAFVGDRLSRDVIGAKNALFACMIQIRHQPSIEKDRVFESMGYKPDYLIDDLAEIPAIIQNLNKGGTYA